MAQPIDALVARLARRSRLRARLRESLSRRSARHAKKTSKKAIATYERTLVSPQTRFDRWIEGDDGRCRAREIEGFRLFTGKAGCANCHAGWAFTDYAFYDIGLPSDDRGRGAVLRLERPSTRSRRRRLREVGRRAPYMHDGSLGDARRRGAALRRAASSTRPTLSPDLRATRSSTAGEQAALVAFLGTLTSEGEPRRPRRSWRRDVARRPGRARHARSRSTTRLHADACALRRGERLWFLNNDTRTHNIRVFDPQLDFDSGAQEPGETVEIAFPESRLVPGVLRHPSEDGADRRRRAADAAHFVDAVRLSSHRAHAIAHALFPSRREAVLTGRRGDRPPHRDQRQRRSA